MRARVVSRMHNPFAVVVVAWRETGKSMWLVVVTPPPPRYVVDWLNAVDHHNGLFVRSVISSIYFFVVVLWILKTVF